MQRDSITSTGFPIVRDASVRLDKPDDYQDYCGPESEAGEHSKGNRVWVRISRKTKTASQHYRQERTGTSDKKRDSNHEDPVSEELLC
jgi:hypothetical protein